MTKNTLPVAWRRIDTPKSVMTENESIAIGWQVDGLFYEALVPLDGVIEIEEENAKLRAFAQEIMEAWTEGSGLDGGQIQDVATKHGILRPETRYEPCSTFCNCADYTSQQEWINGVVCYRKTAMLLGE